MEGRRANKENAKYDCRNTGIGLGQVTIPGQVRHFQAVVFDGVICPERSMRMKSGKISAHLWGTQGGECHQGWAMTVLCLFMWTCQKLKVSLHFIYTNSAALCIFQPDKER